MQFLKKKDFIERVKNEALVLMNDNDRRRRLEGRLKMQTLDLVADALPSVVKFQITSKGLVRADYFALNCKYSNVHVFDNNTISKVLYDNSKYQVIIVSKATKLGVYKVPTEYLENRLNLSDIEELAFQGIAKKHNKLSEVLGL